MFYWNTHNFDFKPLQATHRSTWCLQEHRNWNPHDIQKAFLCPLIAKSQPENTNMNHTYHRFNLLQKNIHSLHFKTEKQKTIEQNRSLQRDLFPTC